MNLGILSLAIISAVAIVGGGIVAPLAAPAAVGLFGFSAIGPVAGNVGLMRKLNSAT